ncbi:MAG TPA: CoA transferase [Burkholderiaceae bacterium]|nr:CoA transferase [Burkholderiaceae bacterium]
MAARRGTRPEGDFARGYDDAVFGESSSFAGINRGEESIALDLRDARDAAQLHELIAAAGVVCLAFGTIDFARELDLSDDPLGLDDAASRIALASRSAGLPSPVAGVTARFDNDERRRSDFACTRRFDRRSRRSSSPGASSPRPRRRPARRASTAG